MTSSSDDPLVSSVLTLASADASLPDEAKYLVLAARDGDDLLAEALDGAAALPIPAPIRAEPVGAFLKSVTVAGCRGIGPKTMLDLHPRPASPSSSAQTAQENPRSPRPSKWR